MSKQQVPTTDEMLAVVASWYEAHFRAPLRLIVFDDGSGPKPVTVPPVLILLEPEAPPHATAAPTLTDCEADVVEVVALSAGRMTTEEILRALQAANRLHGDSTVKMALARLVRIKGVLTNASDGKGKGYALGES